MVSVRPTADSEPHSASVARPPTRLTPPATPANRGPTDVPEPSPPPRRGAIQAQRCTCAPLSLDWTGPTRHPTDA